MKLKKYLFNYFILEMVIIIMLCKFIFLFNFNNYFLNFLILIEYISMTILMNLILMNNNSWIFLVYLIYSVGEAILGLSLMISMNYLYGHQKINLYNLIN